MAGNRTFVDHDACGVGFVAQLGSTGSHEVVERALEALRRLGHRGGVDADGRSGDGAGLLTAIPEDFFRNCAQESGIALPAVFAVGMVFLPRAHACDAQKAIEQLANDRGLDFLGWREVPTDSTILGPQALRTLPVIRQCFFTSKQDRAKFEFDLFGLRKEVESQAPAGTYFCSLSSRTVVYKGLLTPEQLCAFYPDLANPSFISRFAIFHQRYSTNTRPSWSLAQPFRFVAHNGEINTISANRRWLRTKEPGLRRKLNLSSTARLLEEAVSDSASFDNAFEVYLRRGYDSVSAISSMVPPAWEKDSKLPQDLRRFFEVQAYEQEPWDGPAALVFTDGVTVGAKLDCNGLRPLRYTRTSDGLVIVASEVGIADLSEKQVIGRERLGPGEVLVADPISGSFWGPQESVGSRKSRQVGFLPKPAIITSTDQAGSGSVVSAQLMAAFGWSEDQYRFLFRPLVESGQEAIWSMGDDAAPAFLSGLPRTLWDYCKQRFAQVTNPPIDPLRENHVMSLNVYLNRSTVLTSPLIDMAQLQVIRNRLSPVEELDFTFPIAGAVDGARQAFDALEARVQAIVNKRAGLVLLTDRTINAQRTPLPALLALAAVWNQMVKTGTWDVPLIVETGQVIDTHHVALLIAAGASAVVPYVALQQAAVLKADGVARYRTAVEKGLLKVMARMGISNIASYRNSQLFDTIGLDPDLCERFFEDAGCVLGGKGLDELLQDCLTRHTAAFANENHHLTDLGLYRFRQTGERHSTSPEVVRRMHRFIESPSQENFKNFTALAQEREPVAIRDLLEIRPGVPIPLHKVESEASLLSRFSTQAMSLGAISPEAHRTLAIAMNRLGARSNTGEGGEDPELYSGAFEASNRVKQVASARFGVTPEYLVQAEELEIKIAQGAKPGEGGQLPAGKVTSYIARLRHASPNMSLISPPPHHDVYSIEDLAELIYDLRAINPRARIGVKLVSSTGLGIIASGVAKAGADVITISGHDGGTGASPLTSVKNTGLPWEIGLRDAHCSLVHCGLRRRVRLRADGGFKFGRDVIIAALLGADEFGFGTAALLATGCVMARQCHLNTCPVGIASQDEKLRARFPGKPEMVENYFRALAGEVRELLADMGAHSIDHIVGAVERLRPANDQAARSVKEILEPITMPEQIGCVKEPDNRLANVTTCTLDELQIPTRGSHRFPITTADRAIGAHLSGEILRRRKQSQIIESADYEFIGTAGQSFGAFLVPGVNLTLMGEANDYVGKGMSGGSIAVMAGEEACRRGDVLAGNTVLYGATGGELYVAGRVGERFAVRNSGALAVVEGAGQHACEYMTAGVALILSRVGNNLGAGMTGGLVYLLDDFYRDHLCNSQSVKAVPIEGQEQLWLRRVLHRHFGLTGSVRTAELLRHTQVLPFVRIEPLSPPSAVADVWEPILRYFPRRRAVPTYSRVEVPAPPHYRRQRIRLWNQ